MSEVYRLIEIDRLLDINSIDMLKSMIGKRLLAVKCNEDKLCSAQCLVQLDFDDASFQIDSYAASVDYYGDYEEITALEVTEGAYKYNQYALQPFYIGETIKEICIVNYHVCDNNPIIYSTYMYSFTKGIIMTLEDGTQLSFERYSNFTEMVVVEHGTNLIDMLESIDKYGGELNSEWDTERFVDVIKL